MEQAPHPAADNFTVDLRAWPGEPVSGTYGRSLGPWCSHVLPAVLRDDRLEISITASGQVVARVIPGTHGS